MSETTHKSETKWRKSPLWQAASVRRFMLLDGAWWLSVAAVVINILRVSHVAGEPGWSLTAAVCAAALAWLLSCLRKDA